VETDGDSWHARSERIPQDNQRNNELASQGWHVLRFNGNQIHEEKAKYCLENIQDMVNRLGGLDTDGIVPRVFYSDSGKNTQQFTQGKRILILQLGQTSQNLEQVILVPAC
jgi:hypothetical protein